MGKGAGAWEPFVSQGASGSSPVRTPGIPLCHLERSKKSEGTYTLPVVDDPRRAQTAREALLAVRSARVHIQRPDHLSAQDYPPSVSLYAVEAKEVNPPPGQQPIHWRVLTTHEVVCLEQALQVIQWYCWRWRIEQLFATLKQAGLNLEATQLESVAAIQRLTVLALSIAVRKKATGRRAA